MHIFSMLYLTIKQFNAQCFNCVQTELTHRSKNYIFFLLLFIYSFKYTLNTALLIIALVAEIF